MNATQRISLYLCIILSLVGISRAADVEISEFMALNTATVADSYGVYSDWIELHNTTGVGISLDGWYLTDDQTDLTQWRIPSVVLGAGQYLVIYASGEDDDNPAAELHTNFKLSGNGEYLALVAPDGVTVVHEYSPAYPPQSDDVSYGVIDGVEYFFSLPTPAGPNVRLNAGSVAISVPSGTFTSGFQVTLTPESPGATVHYTTNGSTPTTSSPVYSGPISVSSSMRLRAIAAEPGKTNGPLCGAYYIKLATDVQNFDSNLPLVILDSFGASIGQDVDTTVAAIFFNNGLENRTGLTSPTDYAGRAGIHIRGTSSTNFPKKQYKVELWDDSNDDVDVDLFGLGADSDWVLYAPYSDKTYMRNYLAYTWSKMMGDTALDCQFCEVFLNSDGDGQVAYEDYVGVYLLVEKIKIDEERCDTGDMPADPGSADVYNGGFVIEKETSSTRLPDPGGYFNPAIRSGDNWVYRDPAPPEMTTAQKTYVKAKIDRWESVIWSSSLRRYYEDYCNGQSFIDFELLEQFANNNDAWYSSAYVWLNPEDKLEAGPVWDFNIAFGNHYNKFGGTVDWQDIRTWGWWPKLFLDSEFSQGWTDRWFELRRGFFSDDELDAMVDATAAYLAEAEARDHAKWPTLGVYIWPNPDGYAARDTYAEEIDYLKTWLRDRAAWIDSQFLTPPTFSRPSGVVPDGTTVTINSSGGTVYYTTDGSDPRSSGGSISPNATGYTPGGYTTDIYIPQNAVWKYNDTGTDLGTAWRLGVYDDSSWASGPAELGYGDGDEATVVSYGPNSSDKYPTTYFRKTFTIDDVSEVEHFDISILYDDGAVIYVNGYEIARPNLPTGTITYSTYTTATASEGVWVNYSDLSPTLLNDGVNTVAVEIHQRTGTSSDISFNMLLTGTVQADAGSGIPVDGYTHIKARAYNGGQWSAPADGFFVTDDVQLPLVTEINYHPYDLTDAEILQGYTDEDRMEFIELYNPSSVDLNLGGFTFIDGVVGTLGGDAVLAPGEYGVIVSDHNAFAARYGIGPKVLGTYEGALSNSGERVAMQDFLGTVAFDITYNDAGSWPGRADGNGSSMELDSLAADPVYGDSWSSSVVFGGTPGAPNGGVSGDVIVNEVLTHTDLPQVDYIELYNTTGSAIDISGWWLSDETGNFQKYVIPASTVIPAGGYLVFDEFDFNPTGLDTNPANDDPNDFGLNSYMGDDVWLVATAAGLPYRFVEHIEFDAAANGESFGRWPNATGDFYPMSYVTPGAANSGPRIGPIIITELMYSPAGGDTNMQYIEICNIAVDPVDMTGWRIDKGVDMDFPADLVIPAGGYVVVAPFDPTDPSNASLTASFVSTYGIDASVELIGGWTGTLSADGEKVRIVRPDEPPMEDPLFVPQLTAELMDYLDVSPWPDTATYGDSLQRKSQQVWCNAPSNWYAMPAWPGGRGTLPGDASGNGSVDIADFVALKQNYGTTGGATWSQGDFNLDGNVDIQDFVILKQYYGIEIDLPASDD